MDRPDRSAPTAPIRVMIVDDHAMVAESFRRVIDDEPDMVAVGIARNARAASDQVVALRPHVALIDLRLPDGDGVSIGRVLRELDPRLALLLVTGDPAPQSLVAAFDAGFSGYLEKTGTIERLLYAIRQAASGDLVLAPDELARLLPGRANTVQLLTARELEVLELVAKGLTNKEIAATVIVSLNTVRKHVQAVLTKLGAHSKLEAVIIARRRGLIDRF